MFTGTTGIFFYSGHVAFFSLHATWLWRRARVVPLSFGTLLENKFNPSGAPKASKQSIPCNSGFIWSGIIWCITFTSALIMLSTRGHYTIDIFVGFLAGIWLSKYVENFDRIINNTWNTGIFDCYATKLEALSKNELDNANATITDDSKQEISVQSNNNHQYQSSQHSEQSSLQSFRFTKQEPVKSNHSMRTRRSASRST
jgi:hypothetical protein